MDRPTVLHVITGLGAGGAEAMLGRLTTAPGRWRHEVVSLGGVGPLGEAMARERVPVHALGLDGPAGALIGLPALARRIRAAGPAIVQGWMNHGILAATLGHRLAGAPAILLWNVRQSLVDMRCEKFVTRRVLALNARLSRRPAMIFYNSSVGADQHEAIGFAADRRRIVPNGFDLALFSPEEAGRRQVRAELGIGEDEIVVGLVARFHRMKNHSAFLDAGARLIAEEPKVRLLLAGTGMTVDNRELDGLLADPAVRARSLLLGARADMPALTRALDIACNVSIHGEGFSNAVGEAMACAVPCVVTDIGDSAEIVGDTGIVCADSRAEGIAAALGPLVRDPALRRRLGAAARTRMEQNYSLEAVVARYERLYDEAVGSTA